MLVVHGNEVLGGYVWVLVLAVHGNEVFGGYVWVVVLAVHGMGRFCGQAGGGGAGCGAFFVVLCKMIIFE